VQVDSLRAQLDLDIEERESYERFAQGLESDIPEPDIPPNAKLLQDRLLRCLVGIRDAASPLAPCPAVVIEAANPSGENPSGEGIVAIILADTILENNHIIGVVSLYGMPGEAQLEPSDLKNFGVLISPTQPGGRPRVTISGAGANLHVLNNKLTRLTVADEIVEQILKTIGGEKDQIAVVYSRSFTANNVLAARANLLFAFHQALNSNAFNLGGGPDDGNAAHQVIGDSVILIGNYAPDPRFVLFNVSRVNQKSANLTLKITDL